MFEFTQPQFQISPRWNTVAVEHLSNRRHLPVIKQISLKTEADGKTTLSLRIPLGHRSFFGVESFREVHPTIEPARIDEVSEITKMSFFVGIYISPREIQ